MLLIFVVCCLIVMPFSKNKNTKKNNNRKLSTIEKGKLLEDKIYNLINNNIDFYYKIVRNVYIPNNNGKRTEIDFIMVTAYGIFVIESKNYSGIIYGNENRDKWTQFFNKKIKSYYINNPLKQNKYHIKFLSQKLNKDTNDFISYIVFGDNTKIGKIYYNTLNQSIFNVNELIFHIISDTHKRDIIFSHEEIDNIYIDLQYYCEHSTYLIEKYKS